MSPSNIPTAISFARIPLALVLILCFQLDFVLLCVALAALVFAYLTDLADGYVARRLGVVSRDGELWDSLADKAVYISAIIAMNNQGLLHPAIAWMLIFRDVTMYVSRIAFVDRLHLLRQLKPYSYAHCVLIYLTILLGFFEMFKFLHDQKFGTLILLNILAFCTFVVGAFGSLKFVLKQ